MRQVICIPDTKEKVITHLKSQLNMSAYIVSLIEKDMENKLLTKEDIINLIKQYAGGTHIDNDIMGAVEDTLNF